MATRRIKEITNTATTFASDDFIALDGTSQGTRKMDKDDLISQVSAGVSGDYLEEANNLSDVASLDTSKLNMEIPDVGTAPNEVPLNGQLGSMAYQSSEAVSMGTVSADGGITSTADGTNTQIKLERTSTATGEFDIYTNTDKLYFKNVGGGNTIPLTLTDTKVGINTSSPGSTLEVTGASATSNNGATVLVTDSASVAADIGGTIALRGTDGSSDRTLAVVKGGKKDATSAFDGYLSLQTRTNGDANTTEAVRIDSSQRVGIGNNSPGSFYAGANNLVIGNHSGGDEGLSIASGSSNLGRIYFSDGLTGTELYRGSVYYDHSTDSMGFGTGGLPRWSINSSGNLVASSGVGINFGAVPTSGPSPTSSTLDDYEEGTFTPVFADAITGGNTATAGGAQGVYTKIGRVVNFCILLTDVDTTGLTSGNSARVRGLPFDIGQTTVRWESTVRLDNATFTGYVTATGNTDNDVLSLNDSRSGASDIVLTVSDFTSGSADLFITGTYQVG